MRPASDGDDDPPAVECPGDRVDRRPGRYLVAALRLGDESGDRVPTGALSDRLGVRPASVTGMLARLDDEGLVAYEKHRGVELTPRGEAVARDLAWRQCAVRTFFASRLALSLDAHTAYRIGHALPAQGARRLAALAEGWAGPCRGTASFTGPGCAGSR